MSRKQTFTLVAGGNGAGKSTVYSDLLPKDTEYFNGDLVRAAIEKEYKEKYPEYSKPHHIDGAVVSTLEKKVEAAINEKRNFAFETNFSNDMAMALTDKFKSAGYNTSLIYVGLDNLQQSIDRVDFRVLTGGHSVDHKNIEFNLQEGCKRVNENLKNFDSATFVENKKTGDVNIVATFDRQDKLKKIYNKNASWFNDNFKKSFQDLSIFPKIDNSNSQTKGRKI